MFGRRRTCQLARIEETLAAVVAAGNENADEAAGQQAEIMRAVSSLDGRVADLADVVRQVMAQRAGHDAVVAADAKRAATAAESAFVGVQAIASVMTAKPEDGPVPSPPPLAAETPATPKRT